MNISRRDFIKASTLFSAWAALAACTPIKATAVGFTGTASFPSQIPTLDDDELIIHTLRRFTFGDDQRSQAKRDNGVHGGTTRSRFDTGS